MRGYARVVPNNIANDEAGLSDAAIMSAAPSVFATQPWQGVSNKYAFIPTAAVVDKMRDNGFMPVRVMQSIVRIPGKRDFTKHQIRFRSAEDICNFPRVVDGNAHHFYAKQPTILEIALTNAHDHSAAYELCAGAFRFACSNGLIVSSATLDAIRVRHVGDITKEVIEGTFRIVDDFPKVQKQIKQWSQQLLSTPQQLAYARAALALRWGDYKDAPIEPAAVLLPQRPVDASPDVWTTFNRVQEHLIRGGVRGQTKTGKRMSTRAITSVTEDNKLNKALWTLTQELSKQVRATA